MVGVSDAIDALRRRRDDRQAIDTPVTGRVVLVDATGSHVAPLDEDVSQPIGPCRGPAVEVGALVLVVFTDHGPWVAQVHAGEEA